MRLHSVCGQFFVRATRRLDRGPLGGGSATQPLAEVLGGVVVFEALDLCFHQVVRNSTGTSGQVIRQEYPRLLVEVRVRFPPADPIDGLVEVIHNLVAQRD